MPPRRAGPRSLADDLRHRGPDDLVELLLSRPDLARPAPADLTALAARASTAASVRRAVEGLDLGHLQVLEALVVAADALGPDEGIDLEAAGDLLGVPRRRLAPFVARLHALALLWRCGGRHHVVRAVVEALGTHVAGLAPPVAGPGPVPPGARCLPQECLRGAPAPALPLLERLAWGPPVGDLDVESRGPAAAAASWLLARRLLEPVGPGRVLLPRTVALALRGGRLHRAVELEEPALAELPVGVDVAAAAGAERISHLLGRLEELAAEWETRPPRVLRSGGLAMRDLRRVAGLLDIGEADAAFLVELAREGGLVADDGEPEAAWAPTFGYDDWQERPAARRWSLLARAWFASPRACHLIGAPPPPDAPGARAHPGPVPALSEHAGWAAIRAVRLDVLTELAGLPVGTATRPEDLVARLAWRRPLRRRDVLTEAVTAVLAEAEALGVTGRGVLTPAARALLTAAGDRDAEAHDAEALLEAVLPPPVERVLLQADLTAVAPGRPEPGLARFLRLAADVESRGGATVYRFGPDSVRRCLDAGWSVDAVLARLRDASLTPLPQPLAYLVADVARRHGRLRVGAADTYIRSDDASALDGLLAGREFAGLGLRRLAPTVLVASGDPVTVLTRLRAAGLAPVVEDESGVVLDGAAAHRRARPRPQRHPHSGSGLDAAAAAGLVAVLHAAEEARDTDRGAGGAHGPRVPAHDPAVTLALVRDAAVERRPLWVGVTDGDGRARRLLLVPARVEGGRIHGTVDGRERSFSVHRLIGAVPAD